MTDLFVSRTFGPLTEERAVTLLVAVAASMTASAARVWRERTVQHRKGLPLTPVMDMIPDIVLGSMAGLCLALFINWVKPVDAETTWLFAMLGGASGPPLLDRLLSLAAGRQGVALPPVKEEKNDADTK